jgi:ribosomal protein L17
MAFKKGQSGNPAGAPKRPRIFTQSLLTALKQTDADNVEAIQRIADKLVDLAKDGDVQAIKEIADRVEGKVPQAVVGDPDNPLHVKSAVTLTDEYLAAIAAGSSTGTSAETQGPE